MFSHAAVTARVIAAWPLPRDGRTERGGEIEELPAAFLDQTTAAAAHEGQGRETQLADVRDHPRVALAQGERGA
jgi:hypothetical protein